MDKDNKQNKIEKKEKKYSPIDSVLMFFLVLIVPYVFALPIYSMADEQTKMVLGYIIPQVAIIVSFILLSVYRKVNIKKANQINFKLNIWIVLVVLIIGVISIFGFSPLISLFDQIVASWGYKSPTSELNIPTVWSLLAKMIYIALLPAICEELAVRGIMTNGFKKYGNVIACTFSALLFAFMHQNLQQFIYQFFMGYMMAYIVLKTGSIVYTMILHFFNNATVLLTTYINQKNGIAETPIDLSNFWNIFLPILFAILAVGAIIGLLVLINILIKKQKAKKQSEGASNDENVIVFDEQKNQNLQQSEQLEKFFKKPVSLEKLVVIVGIISAFLIWVLAIVQGFLI